jgi:ADP-ribosylglycohydrolase
MNGGAEAWASLRPHHRTDVAEAVTYAIFLGGDTDTTAAMTGALVGAYLGHAVISAEWLARLEDHDRLFALADDVHAAATG